MGVTTDDVTGQGAVPAAEGREGDDVATRRGRLDAALRERFERRRAEIAAKMKTIAEIGPLAYAERRGGLFDIARRFAHMTRTEGLAFEAVVGSNDLSQINFLGRGEIASRHVCRLVDRLSNQGIGTGFLVGPGVLLTNAHVLRSAADASGFVAEFDYEYDETDHIRPTTRVGLDPARVFVTSAPDGLDYCFVALAGDPASHRERGWTPMVPTSDKVLEGEPVVIIQHPGGETKQICLFSSVCIDRFDDFLLYSTDTRPGSSGSPAYSRHWQLVALHHASTPTGTQKLGAPEIANEGIRVSVIVESLRTGREVESGDHLRLHAALTSPEVQADGRPVAFPAAGPAATPIAASPAAPSPVAVATRPTAGTSLETTIRVRPISHYAGRGGYRSNFLAETVRGAPQELEVEMPKVPESLRGDIARTIEPPGGERLDYTHYSVVMSASRRLALVTGCNIDGASLAPGISRTDRDPDRPQAPSRVDPEAADQWYYDPRLPPEAQVGPKIYDETAFDYGHLVRRLDPVWGDARTLRIANDDTFVLTNCAPQHQSLNRKTWLALEDAVQAAALRLKRRFCVFTGPVLSPRDPVLFGVAVPLAFWKVVAWVDGDRLAAMGFVEWQTELVEGERRRFESIVDAGDKSETWRHPMLEIARLTALDFGPLIGADRPMPQGRVAEATTGGGLAAVRVTEDNVGGFFA